MEENEYLIRKSAWSAVTPMTILFFWLIIPLIIMVVRIIILKHDKTYFYKDRVICKDGILSKNETETSFVGISAVSVHQSLLGRIFKYGDIYVDVIGKWKVEIKGVKDPVRVKDYLKEFIVSRQEITSVMEA